MDQTGLISLCTNLAHYLSRTFFSKFGRGFRIFHPPHPRPPRELGDGLELQYSEQLVHALRLFLALTLAFSLKFLASVYST